MKKIYLLATDEKIKGYNITKFFTGESFLHVLISVDDDLTHWYDFKKTVRRRCLDEIKSGNNCKLTSLSVTKEQYENVSKMLGYFHDNKEQYKYDHFGIFLSVFFFVPALRLGIHSLGNICVRMVYHPNKFYCSSFISYILEKSGIKIFKNTNIEESYASFSPWTTGPYDYVKTNLPVEFKGTTEQLKNNIKREKICIQNLM